MLEAELIAFGLSPRQVRVYLALLHVEEGSARKVAEQADLPRLTVYSILERLLTMGLVSCYEKRHARTYHVNAPESFLAYCDQELDEIQVKRQRLERSLPKLCSYYRHSPEKSGTSQHRFRFFQDRTLFQHCCHSLFRKSLKGGWAVHDGSLWPLLRLLNLSASTSFRCLLSSSQRSVLSVPVQGIDVRYIPERFWKESVNAIVVLPSLFFIFEDSLHFLAVEIDHPSTIRQISVFFRMLWQMSAEEGS